MSEHISLDEKLSQFPEFTEWLEDAGGSEAPPSAVVNTSLRTLLGGPGEPITRKGVTFYPTSPGLLELDDLMDVMTSADKPFRRMAQGLTFILEIRTGQIVDGEEVSRKATVEEIGKAFGGADAGLITDLLGHYSGLRLLETSEGNA